MYKSVHNNEKVMKKWLEMYLIKFVILIQGTHL